MSLRVLAREVTEDVLGGAGSPARWTKGMRIMHPDGYEVEITDGKWWGTYGLSNFWHWRRTDTNEKGHGYGWYSAHPGRDDD
jgi:hypothetical protein